MEDLRCVTIHFFYKVEGADLWDGGIGYIKCECEYALKYDGSIETYNNLSDTYKAIVGNQLNISLENIIAISRDEYLKNVDDEE